MKDYGPTVIGVMSMELFLSLVPTVLRVYTRTRIKKAFGWDDSLIILAWIFLAVYCGIIFAIVPRGYGKHSEDVTSPAYVELVKLEIIAQTFAVFSYIPGKISVCVFLVRLFPGRGLKSLCWFISVTYSVLFFLIALFDFVQCNPPRATWDRALPGAKCWNPKTYSYYSIFAGAIGAFYDFVLAAIPWYYVMGLNISRMQKLGIAIILSLGFFSGVCAIFRTYELSTLSSRTDYAYDTISLVIWAASELALVSIAACIPTIRPLWVHYRVKFGGKPSDLQRDTESGSHPLETIGGGRKAGNSAEASKNLEEAERGLPQRTGPPNLVFPGRGTTWRHQRLPETLSEEEILRAH